LLAEVALPVSSTRIRAPDRLPRHISPAQGKKSLIYIKSEAVTTARCLASTTFSGGVN
jgi:hypothetical protein